MELGNLAIAVLPLTLSLATGDYPPAPWSRPAISSSQVPTLLLQAWRKADNRSTCAALAPMSLGDDGQGATPRTVYFSGGWGIAYDKPGLPGRNPDGTPCSDCGRGAFGIAGAGLEQQGTEDQGWPYHRVWADGSRAGYGIEGSRTNQAFVNRPYLAYLIVENQRCLYNVWSFLGKEHLELLLEQLRFVTGAP